MKRYRITVASSASEDVASILSYVAVTDGLEAALAVDTLIDSKLRALGQTPDRGRIVPELGRRGITVYREVIAKPYRIVYRVVRAEVWVIAVVDGRRDLEEFLYERTQRADPS